MAHMLDWKLHADLMDSDHYPIIIQMMGMEVQLNKASRWKMETADWKKYKEKAVWNDIANDVNEACTAITTALVNAAESSIKRTDTSVCFKKRNYWWNEKCAEAVKKRKQALNRYNKHRLDINYFIEYKMCRAYARYVLKQRRKEALKEYLSSLNKDVPISAIWKKLKAIRGNQGSRKQISLKYNNELVVSNKAVADIFGQHYSSINKVDNYTDEVLINMIDQEEERIIFEEQDAWFNEQFHFEELQVAIHSCKDSSPGMDNIMYSFIKNCNEAQHRKILHFYNDIWEKEVMPNSWKESVIIPILKEGKAANIVESYRPISLTSCFGKIMEKMVVQRMHKYLEKNNLLDTAQSGFRPTRSAIDSVTRLEADIRESILRDEYLIAIFFDISKAFDSVWHYGLLKKIKELGMGGHLGNYVKKFLKNRKIVVRINGDISSSYDVDGGVPQGSIISPLLFAIVMNDLFKTVKDTVKYSIYADDAAMWYRCSSLEEGEETIQTALQEIEEWSKNTGLSFSPSKTKAVIFTRKKKNYIPEFNMDGLKIEIVKEKKFLGMILDSSLSWSAHIKSLVERCDSALNIMKYVSFGKMGADRKTLIAIYKALLRSKLDYGCFLYETAASTNLLKLDRVQYKALRLAIGAIKCTPVPMLEPEANIMPLNIRRKLLGLKYICKSLAVENHIVAKEFKDYYEFDFFNTRPHPLPVYGRMKIHARKINLKFDNMQAVKAAQYYRKRIVIATSLAVMEKAEMSSNQWQQLYLDLENYKGKHVAYFTDGSKSVNGVGAGVWSKEEKWSGRMPDDCGIMTAELYAIMKALEISKNKKEKVIIYTDSLSALYALMESKNKSRNYQVHDIYRVIEEMNTSVEMVWIPSHMQIKGNEQADQLAKEGAQKEHIIKIMENCVSVINNIQTNMQNIWQEEWNKKNWILRECKPTIKEYTTVYRKVRKEEIVMARLRMATCFFTHQQYLIGAPQKQCIVCNVKQTIEHLLVFVLH